MLVPTNHRGVPWNVLIKKAKYRTTRLLKTHSGPMTISTFYVTTSKWSLDGSKSNGIGCVYIGCQTPIELMWVEISLCFSVTYIPQIVVSQIFLFTHLTIQRQWIRPTFIGVCIPHRIKSNQEGIIPCIYTS